MWWVKKSTYDALAKDYSDLADALSDMSRLNKEGEELVVSLRAQVEKLQSELDAAKASDIRVNTTRTPRKKKQ
jgi:t-SNARE complex subunit (syntaxin)